MKMSRFAGWLLLLVVLFAVAGLWALLATMGEPQAAWLVCGVIGLEVCQ